MSSMSVQPPRRRHAPSLFWPVVLIGVGIILLLDNQGLIVQSPLALIAQYWPVLLIVAGVELLFSRSGILASLISIVLGLAVMTGAILILTTPGQILGNPMWFTWSAWPQGADVAPEWRTERITQPLQDARNATITLDLPTGSGGISAARDSANLIDGDATYYGALLNDVERTGADVVAHIGGRQPRAYVAGFDSRRVRWDYRLNPVAAYDLDINVVSGDYTFDLSEFRLRGLTLDMASGNQVISLPEAGQYRIKLNMASGSTEFRLPRGLPVRVNYRMLSGTLNAPGVDRVSGAGKNGSLDVGQPATGGPFVTIELDMASGAVNFR